MTMPACDFSPSPESFSRRVLLAVVGTLPQTLTETLYYLCCVSQPAFVPTEVRVITTSEGRNILEMALLHRRSGKFHQFLKDYRLEGQIDFSLDHVHVLADHSGQWLEDVRTSADNDVAADEITAQVRRLTADPHCALHVSIAGGRNTMGVYLGYALSLFGRAQDRLSHVLVEDEFQGHHRFYYPRPEPEVLLGPSRRLIRTDRAKVTLADIPYVSLRHLLPAEVLDGETSYTDTVAGARKSFEPPAVHIQIAERRLVCASQVVEMPPQLLAWYVWMARRCQAYPAHKGHVRWTDVGIAEEFLQEYRRIVGPMAHDYEATAALLAEGMTPEFFQEKKARVNACLKEALKLAAPPYLIKATGRRPTQKFGLSMSAEHIVIA